MIASTLTISNYTKTIKHLIFPTVNPVLVATSIKQATCIKQAYFQFTKQANTLKCICIKQAIALSKQTLIIPEVLA